MAVDKRLTQVNLDKKAALTEVEKTYGDLQGQSDKVYDQQIQNEKNWLEQQKKYQQQQSDLAIHQLEYQKEHTTKDYQREQSAAHVDYQKSINPYGANAEQMAANGLANAGYSESSKVQSYVAYQNRVAVAREAYQAAVHNYNVAIAEAKLQNSYALAEIAYKALQMEAKLSLQKVVNQRNLIIDKTKTELEVENMYQGHYMDVLQQINTEKALAEEQRQFNETMDFNEEQFAWQKAQANKSSSGGGTKKSSGSSSNRKSSTSTKSSINKGKKIETIKNTQSKNKSSEPTVNMSSVIALGYGPISASKLNELVSSGKVVEYEKDGQLYYKKVFNYK